MDDWRCLPEDGTLKKTWSTRSSTHVAVDVANSVWWGGWDMTETTTRMDVIKKSSRILRLWMSGKQKTALMFRKTNWIFFNGEECKDALGTLQHTKGITPEGQRYLNQSGFQMQMYLETTSITCKRHDFLYMPFTLRYILTLPCATNTLLSRPLFCLVRLAQHASLSRKRQPCYSSLIAEARPFLAHPCSFGRLFSISQLPSPPPCSNPCKSITMNQ